MNVQLSEKDRDQWASVFACRTPEKISIEEEVYFQCVGCSGFCGTSHFVFQPQLKQQELLPS